MPSLVGSVFARRRGQKVQYFLFFNFFVHHACTCVPNLVQIEEGGWVQELQNLKIWFLKIAVLGSFSGFRCLPLYFSVPIFPLFPSHPSTFPVIPFFALSHHLLPFPSFPSFFLPLPSLSSIPFTLLLVVCGRRQQHFRLSAIRSSHMANLLHDKLIHQCMVMSLTTGIHSWHRDVSSPVSPNTTPVNRDNAAFYSTGELVITRW